MMNMRFKLILTIVVSFCSMAQIIAQDNEKPKMTVAQLTWGNPEYVYVDAPRSLQWLGDKIISVEGDKIVYQEPNDATKRTLLDIKELNEIEGIKIKSSNRFPRFSVVGKDKSLLAFNVNNILKLVNPYSKEVVGNIPMGNGNVQAKLISPNLKYIAIVKNDNISILSEGDTTYTKPINITTDGSDTIVYGQSVHQNEFGIDGGLFWSKNEEKLAFYRMDQSMIAPYPILNISTTKEATQTPQYYPMAGEKSHIVTIGVYDIKTAKTIYLKTGEPKEKYLTNVTFSPDGSCIYVAEVNRKQNTMELNVYNATTGDKIKTLFTEEDKCYVEPLHTAMFVPNNDNQFIWVSRRDGYRHLYLYNTEGKLLKQLTKGEWEVQSLQGFSHNGKDFFYTSTEISPIDRNCYKVSLSSTKRICLNSTEGFHNTTISPNSKYYLDTFESQSIARKDIVGLTKNGKVLDIINKSKDPDEDFSMPTIKLGKILSADGHTDLYCKTILPPDFDPNKKYPTILYVYNGPHAQLVQNRRHLASMPWSLAAANDGYIVFTVDGRGSDARGAEFEQVIHRNLGENEMKDQMMGIEYLKSLPYIDKSRIGVYGWSYGGFMTINLMLTYPEVFKVAVAGGPVTNWKFYEIMYGERYMDTPEENSEGYEKSNLLLRAKDLKGRLLLIHGSNDPVVMWQHSLAFLKSCVDADTYPDYMVYPGHLHNVRGKDRVHLNNTILRYFNDHLK